MTAEHSRRDRVAQTLSRRKALAGGATLLTAGGTLVWVGDPASAQVSVDELTIPDAAFERESVIPVVDVTAAYEFDAGSEAVGSVLLTLSVDGDTIAREELITARSALSGESTITGRITDAEGYDSTMFAPAVGESVEQTLSVELGFTVRRSDDSEIVSASATEEVVVSVTNPQTSALTAEVGGVGEVRAANPQE